jgi:enoyl-CoA hydratase
MVANGTGSVNGLDAWKGGAMSALTDYPESILVERDPEDERIALCTFNRPEVLNAMNWEMLEGFGRFIGWCRERRQVRVVILTGSGRAFGTGGDLKEMAQMDQARGKLFSRKAHEIIHVMRTMDTILIAAVGGLAVGGGLEFALACDIRIGSQDSTYFFPEARAGVLPGWGGTQLLPRVVGRAWALDMLLTGRRLSAQEALSIGLITRCVPRENLLDEARSLARSLAQVSWVALSAMKRSVNRGLDLDLASGLAFENEQVAYIMTQPDWREGLAAFREKREPRFP